MIALANLKALCETHLAGRCTVEVIDVVEHPEMARADQVVAIPTLIRRLPEPIKKIIGDLSRQQRVLVGLDLQPVGS
jgi:circadian clock protein KaiB